MVIKDPELLKDVSLRQEMTSFHVKTFCLCESYGRINNEV